MSKSTPSTCLRFVFSLALLLPCAAFAQGPTWKPLGPAPIPDGQSDLGSPKAVVSGRILAIAVHPTNPKIVYIGTADGGLRRSEDEGDTWTTVDLPAPAGVIGQNQAIGSLAFAPVAAGAAATLFVGTGQIFSGDSFYGVGVYVLTDGAPPTVAGPFSKNEMQVDVLTGRSVSKIAVDPNDSNTIYLAVGPAGGGRNFDSPPSATSTSGLYRSTNATSAAPTFSRLTDNDVRIDDIVIEPGSSSNLVYSVSNFGEDTGVWRSEDLKSPKPKFNKTLSLAANIKSRLAINKVGDTVTVLVATDEAQSPAGIGTVRKSIDGGVNWTIVPAANGFINGQNNIAIAIDPKDANVFYLAANSNAFAPPSGRLVQETLDGGATFNTAGGFSVEGLHPDAHVLAVSPSNPSLVYFGNDGGIWKTTKGATNWSEATAAVWTTLNNATLSATQFQSIALHPFDRDMIVSGAQDNGTDMRKADGSWTQIEGGDGGVAFIDQSAPDATTATIYHTLYNKTGSDMHFKRYLATNGVVDAAQTKDFGIGAGATPNGLSAADKVLFYCPMALGPGTPNTVYFGSDKLYRSSDQGVTMTFVSPDFGETMSAIGISPQDDNVRLGGLSNGRLFVTTTGSSTMDEITIPSNMNYVTRTVIDPQVKTTAYVTFGGFGKPHIWKTTNLGTGATWTAVSTGISDDLPVNAFVVDPSDSQNLYAGTDIGVYNSTDGGQSWAPYGTGLPRMVVFDMAIQKKYGVLRIATYATGVWEIPTVATAAAPMVTAGNATAPDAPAPAPGGKSSAFIPSPSGTMTFTLTLAAPSTHAITLHYTTVDGTAKAGLDYVAKSGTVTFAPGEVMETVDVQLIAGSNPEPDENFYLELTDPSGASLNTNRIIGTILTDSPAATLSIDDQSVPEGNSGTTNAVFTVTLSVASDQQVTVDYETVAGTASVGNDYLPVSGTLTFAPGVITQPITVPVNGDTLPEGDETFYVKLSNPTGETTITKNKGLGTITNDDGPSPFAAFTSSGAIAINAVGPAGTYPSTINVGGIVGTVNKVTVRLLGLSHTFPGDIDALLVGPQGQKVMLMSDAGDGYEVKDVDLTFDDAAAAGLPADAGIEQGTFKPTDFEPGDTFAAPAPAGPYGTALSVFNGTAPNGAWKLFIMDDSSGDAGTLAEGWSLSISSQDSTVPFITIGDLAVAEGNVGTTGATFTVRLSAPSAVPVTLDFATSDGTATAPNDYVSQNGTLTFAPGAVTRTITVAVNGGTDPEADQTFFVNLTNPANAVIADNQGMATIVNDDVIPSITIVDLGEKVEAPASDGGEGDTVFTVGLSQPSSQEVRVDFVTADGTAKGGIDYEPQQGTLIFAPGEISQKIPIPLLAGVADGPSKTLLVTLSNPVNSTIAKNTGEARIGGTSFPEIKEQPLGRVALAGDTVSFSVGADGKGPLTYQWKFNGANLPGETSDTLTLAKVQAAKAGNYSVVVSNSLGDEESDDALLVVSARMASKALAGRYQGIIGAATFDHRTSGSIQLKVTNIGAFTGALSYGGVRHTLLGRFDADGNAMLVVGSGAARLIVHLALDQSGAGGVSGTVTSGGVTSDFFADTAGADASSTGNFTILLPRNPAHPELTAPQGDGYGVVTVNKFGNIRLRGKLGDGEPVSQGTRLTAEGWWAIYFAPYAASGSVAGWAQFRDTAGVSDLDGSLDWVRPEHFGKQYPAGFTTSIELEGSRYTKPARGTRVLALPGGVGNVTLENGNLIAPFGTTLTLDAANHVVVTGGGGQFTVSIKLATGAFGGNFTDVTGAKFTFSGVVLQKRTFAAGVFVGFDQAGSIEITPPVLAH